MNSYNLFKYSASVFKKSLEEYIRKLKKIVTKHLENNDLKKTKEIIELIEKLRKTQEQIDTILKGYIEQFPEENFSSKELKNSVDDYVHYTMEILRIIILAKQIELHELKSSTYNEIVGYISSKEIANNEKLPNLLNWEVSFYKSITFLFLKMYIEFDENNCIVITDEGKKYYAGGKVADEDIDDYLESLDELTNYTEVFNELIEKEEDMDLMTTIRSYLLSNLISDRLLMADEDSNYYKELFYVIKELKDIDGQKIDDWDQIEENNYYITDSYFRKNEQTVFLVEKYDKYNIMKCIDEDDNRTYYAFL